MFPSRVRSRIRILLVLLLMYCCGGRVASGAPELPGATLLGQEFLGLRETPVTAAQLAELERSAPDQFYSFDASSITRKLHKGAFDLWFDTHPYKNKGTFADSGGTCYGLALQALRWYQSLATEGRYHQGAFSLLPGKPRLREHVLASKANAVAILKEAVDLLDNQHDLGLVPGYPTLYQDHILADLQNPWAGATALGIQFADEKGNLVVGHSVLAIGLSEGFAVSQGIEVQEGGRNVLVGKGHRIHAVRIELWDTNRPLLRLDDRDRELQTVHLLYFPRSGELSMPRNEWYEMYEQHALHQLLDRYQSDPAAQARFRERDRSGTLLQETPTALAPGHFLTSLVNDPRVRMKRAVLDQLTVTPMQRLRWGVEGRLVEQIAHKGPGGPAMVDGSESYWSGLDAVVDEAVDTYIARTFEVADPLSTASDRSVR